METTPLTAADKKKYAAFITTRLDNEDSLAAISYRLQQHGLDPATTRELVKSVAFSHSATARKKALTSIALAIGGTILFAFIGLTHRNPNYILAVLGSLFGGLYQFFTNNKRYRYLKSLS